MSPYFINAAKQSFLSETGMCKLTFYHEIQLYCYNTAILTVCPGVLCGVKNISCPGMFRFH